MNNQGRKKAAVFIALHATKQDKEEEEDRSKYIYCTFSVGVFIVNSSLYYSGCLLYEKTTNTSWQSFNWNFFKVTSIQDKR